MDIDRLTNKIVDEEKTDKATAVIMGKRFMDLHPDIKFVADAWLDGTIKNFEFMGITLDAIQQRDNCSFASAILTMSFLLKKPKYAENFLIREMTIEDNEG